MPDIVMKGDLVKELVLVWRVCPLQQVDVLHPDVAVRQIDGEAP